PDPPTGIDEPANRVRQVELALCVVRRQLVQRAPELPGNENGGRGIELANAALLLVRVPVFYDPADVAVPVADDPAVRERSNRLEGEHGGRGLALSVRVDQLLEQVWRQ